MIRKCRAERQRCDVCELCQDFSLSPRRTRFHHSSFTREAHIMCSVNIENNDHVIRNTHLDGFHHLLTYICPLAWLWFGSVPQYFLLTNLIAVPLTGLIIPISIITVTLHSLGLCPQIITRATECLVSTLTDALEIISDM